MSLLGFDYQLKPLKVANDIWCFIGKLEAPSAKNGGFMSNSCYIKTPTSYILIDSGATYAFAQQAYAAMSNIAKLPVEMVISTHAHDDHWLGNSFYKQQFNAKILGPSLINKEYNPHTQTRMMQMLPKTFLENTKIVGVDEEITSIKELHLGNKQIIIIPVGYKAHTSDDLFVYLPQEKVLFSGDLVMNGRITSNRDGSVIGSLKALEQIQQKQWDVLVPGHGTDTSKTAANEITNYFTQLKIQVLNAIKNDVMAADISKTVTLEEFKDKAMYEELNKRNVFDAYQELEFYEE